MSTTTTNDPAIPATGVPARCRDPRCAAPIWFRRNLDTGKALPLDAEPVASDARLVSARRHHYAIVSPTHCRPATAAEWADHDCPLYVSHFRTCPAVARFNDRGRR